MACGDLYKLAEAFGVKVDDLMPRKVPTDDGAAWLPRPTYRRPGQDSNLRPSAPEADALSTELPGPEA